MGSETAGLDVRAHLALVVMLALSLPWMQWVAVAVILCPLLAFHLLRGRAALRSLLRGLWRLKWLLLAVALLYAWLPAPASTTSVVGGLDRAMILVAMFMSVHTLTLRFGAGELGAALSEWLRPLDRVGLPGSDFARRLALVLDGAGRERQALKAATTGAKGGWLSWVPRRLAGEIEAIERGAAQPRHPGVRPVALPPTPRWQWIVLLLLVGPLIVLAAWA